MRCLSRGNIVVAAIRRRKRRPATAVLRISVLHVYNESPARSIPVHAQIQHTRRPSEDAVESNTSLGPTERSTLNVPTFNVQCSDARPRRTLSKRNTQSRRRVRLNAAIDGSDAVGAAGLANDLGLGGGGEVSLDAAGFEVHDRERVVAGLFIGRSDIGSR